MTDRPSTVTRRQLAAIAAGAAALVLGRGAGGAQAPPATGSPVAGMVTPSSADFRAANLVAPAPLQRQLTGPTPPALIALTDAQSWATAHIAGASQIDWPAVEVTDTSDASIAAWRATVEQVMGQFGVQPGRSVALYDGGTLFAARLWWILDYLGHDAKMILDGGLPAWQAAGLPVESVPAALAAAPGASTPGASAAEPYPDHPVPERLATKAQVLTALNDPAITIIDARKPDEFAAGHIPGAVNVNYPRNAPTRRPEDVPAHQSIADLLRFGGRDTRPARHSLLHDRRPLGGDVHRPAPGRLPVGVALHRLVERVGQRPFHPERDRRLNAAALRDSWPQPLTNCNHLRSFASTIAVDARSRSAHAASCVVRQLSQCRLIEPTLMQRSDQPWQPGHIAEPGRHRGTVEI